jgi:type IV fimbrial biogenesis protein FimT
MRTQSNSGFTLVELMVTLTILTLLCAIALPNLAPFLDSSRYRGITGDISSTIALARSEAIKRGTFVSVAPGGSASDLAEGWVVFVDSSPPTGTVAPTSTVIQRQAAFGTNMSAVASISGSQGFLTFDRLGRLVLANLGAGLGTIVVKIGDASNPRKTGVVCLAWAGRSRQVENATSCP